MTTPARRRPRGLTRDELYERAQKEDVAGRSSMSRKELIEALSE